MPYGKLIRIRVDHRPRRHEAEEIENVLHAFYAEIGGASQRLNKASDLATIAPNGCDDQSIRRVRMSGHTLTQPSGIKAKGIAPRLIPVHRPFFYLVHGPHKFIGDHPAILVDDLDSCIS